MADCECVGGCVFFNDKMANMPGMAGIFKDKYCKNDNAKCARFMIFKKLGKPRVPADLYPNQTARAEMLIAQG